jgi:IS30 family transposase
MKAMHAQKVLTMMLGRHKSIISRELRRKTGFRD